MARRFGAWDACSDPGEPAVPHTSATRPHRKPPGSACHYAG
ncbi:MAG: hypothetical protein QOI35_1227, partial [Cryptosporangiaceae bacterium]|nr:hypothetical protein [Cryptosporangiaceae bacterium]